MDLPPLIRYGLIAAIVLLVFQIVIWMLEIYRNRLIREYRRQFLFSIRLLRYPLYSYDNLIIGPAPNDPKLMGRHLKDVFLKLWRTVDERFFIDDVGLKHHHQYGRLIPTFQPLMLDIELFPGGDEIRLFIQLTLSSDQLRGIEIFDATGIAMARLYEYKHGDYIKIVESPEHRQKRKHDFGPLHPDEVRKYLFWDRAMTEILCAYLERHYETFPNAPAYRSYT